MKGFPTKTLLLAPLPLWVIVAAWHLVEATGHQLNVHGDAIPMVAGIFLSGLSALIAECIAVLYAIRFLRRYSKQRLPKHYLALLFGAANLLVIAGFFFYVIFLL